VQSARVDQRLDGTSIIRESTDTPVLCRAHSGMPEHTAGTGFDTGRVASAASEAVKFVQ